MTMQAPPQGSWGTFLVSSSEEPATEKRPATSTIPTYVRGALKVRPCIFKGDHDPNAFVTSDAALRRRALHRHELTKAREPNVHDLPQLRRSCIDEPQ